MGNPITDKVLTGTMGEMVLQIRLLEYGIQSAPPLKDSGNDLIAIKGNIVRFIQVKTSKFRVSKPSQNRLPEIFHLIALVKLKYSKEGSLLLDESDIFMYEKDCGFEGKMKLDSALADKLWRDI